MTKAKELSELASAATVTSGNVALSGGLDVDGVTDLDVVDIDGAVNMATTALVTGVLTTTAATVHTNGITMPDSAKAIFGAGSDLQIYHDSSNSYIQDTGTGNLHIRASSGIYLQGANAENGVTFFENGAVTLYHNNAAKLATTATGIDISGTAIVDRIQSANDSSDPWLKGTNSGGTETSYIKKDGTGYFGGGVAIGGTGTANTLEDYEEGAVSLALTGANGNPSTAVAITGTYVKIGRSVNVRVLNTSFNNTGAAGPIALTGFPFASAGAYGIGSIGETNDMMTFTNSPFIVVSGDAGYIYQNISEANSVAVNHHVDAACSFIMNVIYETNS
jgi:hypothetical protein